MMRLHCILLMIISVSSTSAQPPILWENVYGEYEMSTYLFDVEDFYDNQFLFTGATDMYSYFDDVLLLVTDDSGNILAEKILGGSYMDGARSLVKTDEDHYVFLGSTESNDGDVSGNHGNYDIWVSAVDSVLNLQWQICLGGSGDEDGYDIIQAAAGQYVAVGITSSNNGNVSGNHGLEDIWLVSFTSDGTVLWQRCLGGQDDDRAFDLLYMEDGGFMVAGYAVSVDGDVAGNHGQTDAWVIRLDSTGNIIWQKCFGGSLKESAKQLAKLSNGYFAFTGTTESSDGDVAVNHGLVDLWLVVFDEDGNMIFEKTFGGSSGESGLFLLPDEEGILFAGSYWDGSRWLLKTDNSGNLLWEDIHQPFDDGSYRTGSLIYTTNDDFVGCGSFTPDCCVESVTSVFRYGQSTTGLNNDPFVAENISLVVYPNPNSGEFTVKHSGFTTIEIFNALGQSIFKSQSENREKKEIKINLQHSGSYFIRLTENGRSKTGTIMVLEN